MLHEIALLQCKFTIYLFIYLFIYLLSFNVSDIYSDSSVGDKQPDPLCSH